MSRPGFFAIILTLLILTGPTHLLAADVPDPPQVEVSFATEGPLSLFCSPAGGGHPFTQAFDPMGNQVDGTLSIILYDNGGVPVPNYPNEDLWLMDFDEDLAICNSGTICDENTDPDGRTYWSNSLSVGGHAEPVGDNRITINVNGWGLDNPDLAEFRINSSDINGDLSVNLLDLTMFSYLYFGPYGYEGDFHWDGVINLADLAAMARTYWTECP